MGNLVFSLFAFNEFDPPYNRMIYRNSIHHGTDTGLTNPHAQGHPISNPFCPERPTSGLRTRGFLFYYMGLMRSKA
jgi:hypothetical protein